MKKIIHLALHNLKKEKKQYFSFGIIAFITAFILNLALVLSFSVNPAYDSKFVELNASDIDAVIPKIQDSSDISNKIKCLDGVESVEVRDGIFLGAAVVKDFRGTDFDMNIVFYNKDDIHKMNRLETVDKGSEDCGNPIYLPLYISEFGKFEIGQKITFETDKQSYTFETAGIVQEMQYGNYGGGMMGVYLPNEAYRKFAEENAENAVRNYSVKISEGANPERILNKIRGVTDEFDVNVVFDTTGKANKQTRTMVCNLLIIILTAFSLIVLLVSMFLCKFRIQNTIEEEMSNMGVLKALGFTSNMIISSVMLPYIIVGIISSALGVAVSYLLLPSLVNMLALQAGFSFKIGFDAASMLITICVLTVVITAFTYLAGVRIRRLNPISAIRGETEKSSLRKNHFPIDNTPGNVQAILTLKHMASSMRQNSLLFLVLFVMTMLISFSGNLFYNVIIKPDNFMSTLSEESPSAVFQISVSETDRIKDELQNNKDVNAVLKYATGSVKIGNEKITAFICEDFAQTKNNLCYKGRNPQSKDEIAVGSNIAKIENYQIGDKIKISHGENTNTYEIVGFVQSVNYQGKICALTNDGFAKLKNECKFNSLYVYLNDGADTEKFISEFEKTHSNEIKQSINFEQKQKTAQEMYSSIVNIVIIAIFAITTLIVLLILFIIIKSVVVQRKQELGIYKAIGYSSRQLIMQIAGSFMPISILAILSSAILGLLYIPAINSMTFSMIGAMKNNLKVSAGILIAFAAVELILTFIISLIMAAPIKKISAYSLIKE